MAIFNKIYSPLRTQLSMLVAEGSLTQDYDADNKVYTPDRRIRPTAIQPICSITDPSGILENGTVNSFITDIKWYENEISEANLISPTNSSYKIDSTSNTNNRGRIVVTKNVHFDEPVTLIFTATYADMVNGKLRRKAYFVGRAVLASNVAASSPLVLKTDYPRGRCFNPIKELSHLKLTADLVSGDTNIPSAYWWYKKNGMNESLITDYEGCNSRELKVPTASIGKEQHYVCKAQDCRQNLTDLRNVSLQENLDKISEYPRNLLAKQYFLDLNNEIGAGTAKEGEDADGKYISIPSPSKLHSYVGGSQAKDLFKGKIVFKENTIYTLRVSAKYVTDIPDNRGVYFIFKYTNGTSKTAYVSAGIGVKKEVILTSEKNKTVSHISCSYGYNVELRIYDIQLTEEYNYNLLEGNTEEITISIGDTGEAQDNYKMVSRRISKLVSPGQKLTLYVDDIANLKGDASEYTASLYQTKEGLPSVSISNNVVTLFKKRIVYTIGNQFDPTLPVSIYFYAGKIGSTAGKSVSFRNVQLVEGEFANNVLGKDIEEVIVEAGDTKDKYVNLTIKEPLKSGNKYIAEIGGVENQKGTADKYTVRLYQFGGVNAQISTLMGSVTASSKTVVFTVADNYNPNIPAYLLLYAGETNKTTGNSVKFTNVRLLQGETILPSIPAYSPHFIPAAPDVQVESESIQLPEGYRPTVQGKTIDEVFTLVTRLPPYKLSVVTPYGDDSGVISIPSDVKLFPAWIKVDVSGIGTLDNPEKYFSADWGNGLKGMKVLLDADDIGLGVQEVAPDVVEEMEYVRYGLVGPFSANTDTLEEFSSGTKFIIYTCAFISSTTRGFSIRKEGVGVYTHVYKEDLSIYLVFGNLAYKISEVFSIKVPHRIEVRLGDSADNSQILVDGIKRVHNFTPNDVGLGNTYTIFYAHAERAFSLIEIYQNNTLLHKWNFEGATTSERLSDKADTSNKIKITMSSDSAFIPI